MAQSLTVARSSWPDRSEYPFASHFLELPEGKLHYVDEGSGPALVFAHGTPTWSYEFRHLIRALSQTHRCVALDHLGFGLSDRPEGADYTPEAHAARFAAFVDRVVQEPFTLVAHDFGGPISLAYAVARPARVTRVVLLNTWAWSFDRDVEMIRRAKLAGSRLGRWLYAWLNFSLRAIMPSAYGDRRKLTRAVHAQYLAAFPDRDGRVHVLWALARSLLASGTFFESIRARLPALRATPVLVVWGLSDSAFRPAQLATWRAELPHARVATLAGAGHWPHEEEPDAVLAAMAPFLAEASAGDAATLAPS